MMSRADLVREIAEIIKGSGDPHQRADMIINLVREATLERIATAAETIARQMPSQAGGGAGGAAIFTGSHGSKPFLP